MELRGKIVNFTADGFLFVGFGVDFFFSKHVSGQCFCHLKNKHVTDRILFGK